MPNRLGSALVAATLLLPACSSGATPESRADATPDEVDAAVESASELSLARSDDTTSEAATEAADDDRPADDATAAAASDAHEVVTATDGRWATVTMGNQGGLCPEGVCSRHVIADEADQSWSASTSAGESSAGEVDAATIDALARLIESHWEALTATPFEGDCPTAHDGQERIIDVTFAPVDGSGDPGERISRTTSSCTHAWPRDVVAEIDTAWDDAGLPR